MKKTMTLLLALVMLLIMAACALGESLFVDNRETDKVYPERLNLRAEPSKSGAILGLYYTGAQVENLGAENEEYTKVHIGGMTGYMASEYLITAEEAVRRYGEDSGFGSCRQAQVDLTGMWTAEQPLYSDTDLLSQPHGSIQSGAAVELVGVLDDWAYIAAQLDGQKTLGYVPLDCLTDVGELKVSVIAGTKADSRTILYDAPNNKAQEIMSIKNGTACFNLFGRKEGEWRRVRVGGVSGWIKYTQTSSLFSVTDQQPRSAVPYYPLLMQAKADILLLSAMDDPAKPYMTLGKDMKVELLAECGDYAYVRTLEGGAGAYDCGDFGYVKLSDLTLAQVGESIGVAQADHDDVPVILLAVSDPDAEMLGALCPGAQVRIIEYTQTDYVQVALGELRGYIPKDEIRVLSRQGDQPSERIPQRATVLKDTLMKNTPSDKTKDGQMISKGERVYMLGSFGDWAFVQHTSSAGLDPLNVQDDRTGFMKIEDLNAPAGATHLTAFVNTDKVNLRSQASSASGGIIDRARTGERLRVAEYGKDWCAVVTPKGMRGYMKTEYLDFE
ncbi:MAG: SH3 domain-containing protein [Clostridia bacterium]|nr:SH3 domain-containing protein [Clostridia bacterium]